MYMHYEFSALLLTDALGGLTANAALVGAHRNGVLGEKQHSDATENYFSCKADLGSDLGFAAV